MDGPIEKLVTRKRDIVDVLSIILVITAATVFMMIILAFNFFTEYVSLVFAALLFFVTKFIFSRNIEFEYSYFDGDLEIDKIINKKKRKRVALVSVKDFEVFGPQAAFVKVTSVPQQTIYCCSYPSSKENYFFIANYNSKKTVFYFEPNEQIIKDILRRAPQKLIKGE